MLKALFVFPFLLGVLSAQNSHKPLTQVEACQEFDSAIVGIHGYENGTGFIVSSDGWILTAAHLVINPTTRQNNSVIQVFMPDGSLQLAIQVVPIEEALLHDFALLKVDKINLPHLEVGSENDVAVGSNITIIGFPLSTGIVMKFCLAGTIVAKATVAKGGTQINIVFFQGISIKGISGAPMISLDTGKVIGIENLRLTGIGPSLEKTKEELASGMGGGVIISGIQFGPVLSDLVNTLDTQLANGLGAGNGTSAAGLAFKQAQRDYQKK
jgi:S1-C subfamily serine protease